jgi:predicted lysophospholipase L1 biosynthesis ABC-type transport system permease subunit
LAGRTFDQRDDARAPGRMVVSANLARTAFPGLPLDSVVGQRLVSSRDFEIIGVVGDVALNVYGTSTMAVYRPHAQFADDRNWALTQVIATDRSTEELLNAVRREVARLDPELVVHRPATMGEIVDRGTGRERFALALMGAFALIALALAALGLYGVLAYSVRQRSSEIGIRIALGATGSQVRALVFRQAAVVVGVGVAVGLAGALILGRWVETLAFGVAPSDPRILIVSAGVLAMVALVAAWLPARRAAGVEPRVAMQESY